MSFKISSAFAPVISYIVALPFASGQAALNVGARNPELSLTVYVQTGIGDSGLRNICMRAQGVAYQMFAAAGVRIHWRTGQPKSYEPGRPILIDFTSSTPETFHRGALAYARVFEGDYIRVFYDRVENPSRPQSTAMLLAHVMVHEIAHILEGVDGHSERGIMKAFWTPDDVVKLAYQPLQFDPADVVLIHKGLANRSRTATNAPSGLVSVTQSPHRGPS